MWRRSSGCCRRIPLPTSSRNLHLPRRALSCQTRLMCVGPRARCCFTGNLTNPTAPPGKRAGAAHSTNCKQLLVQTTTGQTQQWLATVRRILHSGTHLATAPQLTCMRLHRCRPLQRSQACHMHASHAWLDSRAISTAFRKKLWLWELCRFHSLSLFFMTYMHSTTDPTLRSWICRSVLCTPST